MKAQFFSSEAIFNLALFGIIFLFFLFIINNKINDFKQSTQEDYLIISSNNIINILSMSKGIPYNWSHESFSMIGLCDFPKIISPLRLENFKMLLNDNYSEVLKSFSIEAYPLYVSLEYFNGSKIYEYKPRVYAKNVLINKRKVIYENEPAILKIGVIN